MTLQSRPRPFWLCCPGEAERERLTAPGGLAAFSLDALSGVPYGPEAILIVLVAAGLRYGLPAPGSGCCTNQRGPILDRAIRHGTDYVVLCRLRCRLGTLAAESAGTPARSALPLRHYRK